MTNSIALTFDDGPNTVTTPQVLDRLKKYEVTASFFLVGDNITEDTAAVSKAAFDMGCELCNHSRTHTAMPTLTAEEIRAEIAYTNSRIFAITGEQPTFFRPPYIAVNNVMYENIDMTFIAGIGAEDWLEEVTAEMRAEKILSQVRSGDIILLHDMEGNAATVAALDIIIPELKRRGFEFVTVTKLFEINHVLPLRGNVYSNVLASEGG